jgi:hypothetical protein
MIYGMIVRRGRVIICKKQGTREQGHEGTIRRGTRDQGNEGTRRQGTGGSGKAEIARRMGTSRAHLDKRLEPENDKVQLETVQRAATAVGRRVRLVLV